MRAYTLAVQPPAGLVYLSIPLDDWDQPALGPAVVRTVSMRFAPDPDPAARAGRSRVMAVDAAQAQVLGGR